MPTYDYRCSKCGDFEHVQSITEPALAACPRCGGPVQRLISRNIGILFKGPGFYVTDNRKAKGAAGGKEETPAAGKEAPKADASKADAPKTEAPKGETPKAASGEGKAAGQ